MIDREKAGGIRGRNISDAACFCQNGSYKFCVFVYGFTDDIFNMIADMVFSVFVQLIRVDRLSIFNYHMGFPYLRHMIFKNLGRVVQ